MSSSSISDKRLESITFEELKKLMEQNRSIRRFDNSRKIDIEEIRDIIGLVRLCASGRNAQPMKYRIISDHSECEKIYPLLAWAGYYKDWSGPESYQRPVAYVIQCLDSKITENPMCDDGLQLEAITLGAASKGIGCCIIKSFNPDSLSELLNIPKHLNPRYVIALGYPAEKAKIVDIPTNGDFKYYRNESDIQCVPKRSLSDLII